MFNNIEIVEVNEHRHDVRLMVGESAYDLKPSEVDGVIERLKRAVKAARAADKASRETPL